VRQQAFPRKNDVRGLAKLPNSPNWHDECSNLRDSPIVASSKRRIENHDFFISGTFVPGEVGYSPP
jgi:hypothetical protein